MGNFKLYLVAGNDSMIRISKRILEYFETFIINEVLAHKNIILNSKTDISISFHLLSDYKERIEKIELYNFRQTYNEKVFSISIPVDRIKESNNINIKSAQLFYEGISLFFITNFKKIKAQFMDDLSEKVDWEYLNSMPYPAHLKDIEYVGENYMSLSKTMGWS